MKNNLTKCPHCDSDIKYQRFCQSCGHDTLKYVLRKNETFLQLCIDGKEKIEHIDDYISVWNMSNSISVPLHEYLGMTEKEYTDFVHDENNLKIIFDRRLTAAAMQDVASMDC